MGTRTRQFVRVWMAILRLVSAIAAVVGIGLLRMGYPPRGSDSFALVFVGGIFALVGIIGIFDPARVTPARGSGRDHSD